MTMLERLLDDYEAALNAGHVGRLAACHSESFMQMSRTEDGLAHAWRKNDAEFGACLERAFHFYRMLGAVSFRACDVKEGTPQPSHWVARVAWRVSRRDGSELVTLDVSYMVRLRTEDAQIVAFVNHDEQERLQERGFSTEGAALLFELPHAEVRRRQRSSPSSSRAINKLFQDLGRSRMLR